MSSLCYKCEKEIADGEDYGECDCCDQLFHLKCDNVTKKEWNARKNSKCLRLFCNVCFDDKSNGTADKLKLILNVLYKLDFHNQQQVSSNQKDVPSSILDKLNAIDTKVSSIKTPAVNGTAPNRNATQSYANVVKKTVKPAVVIKPKTKQISSKTLEEISNNVDKTEINVCSTRNVRDGGVVLRCENPADTMKVKQMVNDKLGDKYEVTLPKIKNPRLRVTNVDAEIEKDSILNELKKHNDQLKNAELSLVTVINRKRNNHAYNDVVIEMKADLYKAVLEKGSLKLPWRECRVYEHIHLKRCFKCCGYSHKSNECKHDQKCSRCAGSHKYSDCKNSNLCCVNCKFANDKYNMNIDTNHHAWSKDCPVYKRRVSALVSKIEYSSE